MSGGKAATLASDGPSAYLFDALLTPNRSLPRAGFIAVMAAVTLISAGLGVYFVLHGAWPVFRFFGLDVLLLFLAFRLNYRSGRASEIVRLTPDLRACSIEPSM